MGFDENGIYHQEIYNQPQTGALGALDILNQINSYGNYQKAAARRSEADIANQATEGEKHGQDFSQYPEYQANNDTLGISQDTAQGIFGNIPQQKLKAALSAAQAAKGDEPLDEDDVSKVYLAQGVTPPTSYLNSSAKKDAAAAKAETAFQAQAARAGDAAYKGAWEQGLTDAQARQAKIDAIKNAHTTAGHDIEPDQETNWAKYVAGGTDATGPKVTQSIETSKTRADLNTANAAKADATTDQIQALTDPKAAELMARTGLENERVLALRTLTSLQQIKLQNGGLTQAGQMTAEKSLAALDSKIADKSSTVANALATTPDAKAANAAAIQQMKQSSDHIRQMLGQAPKYGATAPAKADTAESIAADYKAGKITRDEAAAKLKALGHPGQ